MDRIEVSQVNRICANCGMNGHNTGSSICSLYGIQVRPVYRSRCSRCYQPGHNRSNRRLCSLYNEYRDYYYVTHTGVISRNRRIDLVKDLMRELRRNLVVFTQTPSFEPHEFEQFHRWIRIIDAYDFNNITETELSRCEYFVDRIDFSINNYWNIHYQRSSSSLRNTPELREKRNVNVVTRADLDLNGVEYECNICYENKEHKTACEFDCNHQFCIDCVCGIIKSCIQIKCPMCRNNIYGITCNDETNVNKIIDVL